MINIIMMKTVEEEAKNIENINWNTIFTSSKEEVPSKTMLDYLGLSS